MKKIITSFVALLSIVGGASFLRAEEQLTYVVGVSDSNEVTIEDDGQNPIKYNWVKYPGYSYYAFDLNGLSYDLGLVVSEREGYRFDGWYTLSSGKDGSGGPKDCDKKISTDLHITWSEITSKAATSSDWNNNYLVCPKFVKVWTVSASASPAEGGTVSGAGTVDEGASVTLTATPNEGYSFDSWSDGSNANPRKITGINADKTYTAVFTPKRYTLKVDPNGGTFMGSAEPYLFPVDRLTWGQKTLNSIGVATKSDGSELQGFRDLNGQPVYDAQGQNVKCDYWTDSYKNGGVFKGTSNLTVRAIWGEPPKRYTITATAEPNAAGTVLGADTYVEGVNVTLEAQPSPGYSFAHWLKGDEALTDNPLKFTATADVTCTAVFTGNVYAVTFFGMEGQPAMQTVDQTFGSKWKLPVATRDGYEFDGWYTQPMGQSEKLSETDTFNQVLTAPLFAYANWTERKDLTVTFVDPTESPVRRNDPIPVPYTKGDKVIEPPDRTNGWSDKWFGEYWIAGWNPPLPQVVSSDLTITAVRESIATVLDCEDQGLVFRRNDNWQVCTDDHFAGNSCLKLGSVGGTDTVRTALPAGDGGLLTFYWKSDAGKELTVKVSQGGEDYGLPNFVARNTGWNQETIEIRAGGEATVVFTCSEQVFDNSPRLIDTVSWQPGAKPSRTVTVTCGEHGKLKQGSTGAFPHGSDVTLEAEADPGYAFCCWTNDTGFATNDNPWTFTVVKDVSYKATFTNAQYVVTLDQNGGTGGDASVIATYDKPLPDLASLPSRTDGWTFNGYTNAAGVAYYDADGESAKDWDQPNAATLFAQWKAPDQYSLTVTHVGRGSVDQNPPGGQFVAGTQVELEAKPDVGAVFAQWSDGVESSTRTVTMTGNISLTATFTNCQYVVTFDANEGSVTPSTKIVTYGETYGPLPEATLAGFTFDGWFTAASGGDQVESTTNVTTAADHTLFAHWKKAVSELSKALDCDNLEFAAAGGWAVFTNSAYAKEGVSCLSNSVQGATLATTVTAAGTLTFWWRGKGVDDFVRVKVSTNAVEIKSLELNVSADGSSGWEQKTLDVVASAEMPVTVKFEANKSRYNGVMALDFFTWVPATPAHPEPTDADRVTISAAGVTDGKFRLSFVSDERFDYNLLTNANLLIDSWGVMEKKTGGGTVTFEPEIVDGLPQLFYKVETIQRQD